MEATTSRTLVDASPSTTQTHVVPVEEPVSKSFDFIRDWNRTNKKSVIKPMTSLVAYFSSIGFVCATLVKRENQPKWLAFHFIASSIRIFAKTTRRYICGKNIKENNLSRSEYVRFHSLSSHSIGRHRNQQWRKFSINFKRKNFYKTFIVFIHRKKIENPFQMENHIHWTEFVCWIWLE